MNPIYYVMPVMFYIVPVFMCVILGAGLIRTIREWRYNEQSPRLTVPVTVVARRSDYRRTMTSRRFYPSRSRTSYFVTFQVESGDRMELELEGNQYGLMVEGDQGKLTFQGRRFLNFERTI